MTAKDTPPAALRSMAEDWLYEQTQFDKDFVALLNARTCTPCASLEQTCRCPISDEWVEALAREFDAAISDRRIEWLQTLKDGRAPLIPVVEWQMALRQHESCCTSDPSLARRVGTLPPTCCADLIPREDAPEAAAGDEHRWG